MNGLTAQLPHASASVAQRKRALPWVRNILIGLASVPIVGFVASLVLTPPLEPAASSATPLPAPELSKAEAAAAKLDSIVWPETPLSGTPAKQLLFDVIQAGHDRLEAVEGYTATLTRQERIKNKVGPEQVIDLKVRHRPFGVYMHFRNPDKGKEAVYAEGRYDNHIMAHGGGLSRALIPRLKVPPDSALAMAGNRHPITDAGLLNLAKKLLHFRALDLKDTDAGTTLDRVADSQGRTWLRSVHTHTIYSPERPFMYVEVLYDPATKLPVQIESYEWPKSGRLEDRIFAERYRYDDLVLDAPLTDLDFDPANPNYEFHRF